MIYIFKSIKVYKIYIQIKVIIIFYLNYNIKRKPGRNPEKDIELDGAVFHLVNNNQEDPLNWNALSTRRILSCYHRSYYHHQNPTIHSPWNDSSFNPGLLCNDSK